MKTADYLNEIRNREGGDIPEADDFEKQVAARFQKIQRTIAANPHEPLDLIKRTSEVEQLRKDANLPKRHQGKTELKGAEWLKCFSFIKAQLGTGFILALIGTRGSGKTQMGVSTILEQTSRLKASRYVAALEIFLDVKSAYRKDAANDERAVIASYFKPQFLVIDEIQERAETPWEDRILTNLIDQRYRNEKDTLLIGNITEESFRESMGSSIVRRLNDTGGIITADWEKEWK